MQFLQTLISMPCFVFLVGSVFYTICLFAEDSGIYKKKKVAIEFKSMTEIVIDQRGVSIRPYFGLLHRAFILN